MQPGPASSSPSGVEVDGERVDERDARRPRDLDQREAGPVRALAVELGVERVPRLVGERPRRARRARRHRRSRGVPRRKLAIACRRVALSTDRVGHRRPSSLQGRAHRAQLLERAEHLVLVVGEVADDHVGAAQLRRARRTRRRPAPDRRPRPARRVEAAVAARRRSVRRPRSASASSAPTCTSRRTAIARRLPGRDGRTPRGRSATSVATSAGVASGPIEERVAEPGGAVDRAAATAAPIHTSSGSGGTGAIRARSICNGDVDRHRLRPRHSRRTMSSARLEARRPRSRSDVPNASNCSAPPPSAHCMMNGPPAIDASVPICSASEHRVPQRQQEQRAGRAVVPLREQPAEHRDVLVVGHRHVVVVADEQAVEPGVGRGPRPLDHPPGARRRSVHRAAYATASETPTFMVPAAQTARCVRTSCGASREDAGMATLERDLAALKQRRADLRAQFLRRATGPSRTAGACTTSR